MITIALYLQHLNFTQATLAMIQLLQLVRLVRQRFQLRLIRAAHLLHHDPVAVQLKRRHRWNPARRRDVVQFVHVYLHERDVWELCGELFEVRADRFARATPGCREVHQ